LKLVALEEKLLSGSGTFFKIVLPASECQLLLQVGKDMAFPNLALPSGSVIDIDAFLAPQQSREDLPKVLADFSTLRMTPRKSFSSVY
jgi:hypothetical protein